MVRLSTDHAGEPEIQESQLTAARVRVSRRHLVLLATDAGGHARVFLVQRHSTAQVRTSLFQNYKRYLTPYSLLVVSLQEILYGGNPGWA